MSVSPYPHRTTDSSSSADLQVWNNAAFDNNDYSQDLSASTQSWGSLKSIFGQNPNDSFDSDVGKENQGPVIDNCSVSVSVSGTTTPFKPVNRDRSLERSKGARVLKKGEEVVRVRDEKKIDEEIEEIESKIGRLSVRLEALRLEKAKSSLKVEKRGRVISAKFMETKRIEEDSGLSAKPMANRRGLSLGPAEIVNARRRGMSMGPSEIVGASKMKPFGRMETITPVQSRRKSCFLKLQNIEEEKPVKSSSVSPKSRKLGTKNQVPPRQAVTTVSRKVVKKEDGLVNSVQPKKLFRDGEKSVPATNKKPMRPGRVVASRYSQNAGQGSVMKKRSLPETDKDDGKNKKRSLSSGKSDVDANDCKELVGSVVRVKKRWEIPSEIVVHGSEEEEEEKSPEPVVVISELLPKIRTARFVNETPRDSGAAKRVAELVGKKSFFADGDGVDGSVCQTLSYAED